MALSFFSDMTPSHVRVATRFLAANSRLVAKFKELDKFYRDVVKDNNLPVVSDQALANAVNGTVFPLGHAFVGRLSSKRSPEVVRADHRDAARTYIGRLRQFFALPSKRDAWAELITDRDVGFTFPILGGEATVTIEPKA